MGEPSGRPVGERVVGRLAPTPSAGLHIGNIFSCLVAWLAARSRGGEVVLRIEDVDRARCRREYVDAILRDLETLGITWDNTKVMFQSERTAAYDAAFARLDALGDVYPCFCSRADLHAASAPHAGEHYVYAGTCRYLTDEQRAERSAIRPPAYRLAVPSKTMEIDDKIQGRYSQDLALGCGDFIIRRSDGVYSYQLAVVVDDLAQGVNQVVRGYDLLESAPQQDYLRCLIDPDAPLISYAHVPLLLDEKGRRLSKRDRDMGLEGLLEHFGDVPHLLGHLAEITGLQPDDTPVTAEDLVPAFDFSLLQGKRTLTWKLPE